MDTNDGMVVDLGDMIPVDSIEVEILKMDGVTGTGWRMLIAGPAHPKRVSFNAELSRKNLRRQRMIEQAQANGRKFQAEDRSLDDQRRDNTAWIVAHVIGWRPAIKLPGIFDEPTPFSDEALTKVLMDDRMGWVLSQLVDVITEDKRFTPRSSTTSESSPSASSL